MEFYNSTANDEWIIKDIYPNKKDGVFVEAGACGGLRGSSTYNLEQLGWTGFLFEPNTEWYERCVKIRPNSKVFNYCLGFDEEVDYIQFEQRGRSTTKPYSHHFKLMETMPYTILTKKSVNLSTIIKDCEIDYLALDTNGNEYDILKTVRGCNINVISVEATQINLANIRNLLYDQGFDEVTNPYNKSKKIVEYYFVRK